MLRKPGDTEFSPSMDGDVVVRDEEGKNITNDYDIEKGIVTPANLVHANSSYFIDDGDLEYTHILIPCPGSAIINRLEKGLDDCRNRKPKFIQTSKVGQDNNNNAKKQGEGGISCTKDKALEVNDAVNNLVTETRPVPIYCAVCLTRYEVSNRVCWSSNSECSHVFHEDCMLHWLVVLGRKRSRRKRFSKNPSERKLLDFDLSCPCCRQDFISRDVVLGTDEDD